MLNWNLCIMRHIILPDSCQHTVFIQYIMLSNTADTKSTRPKVCEHVAITAICGSLLKKKMNTFGSKQLSSMYHWHAVTIRLLFNVTKGTKSSSSMTVPLCMALPRWKDLSALSPDFKPKKQLWDELQQRRMFVWQKVCVAKRYPIKCYRDVVGMWNVQLRSLFWLVRRCEIIDYNHSSSGRIYSKFLLMVEHFYFAFLRISNMKNFPVMQAAFRPDIVQVITGADLFISA